MFETTFALQTIGVTRPRLISLDDAPLQGDEGAPEAWLEFNPSMAPGLSGIAAGDELIVFATRSPDRPNPVGLHTVRVLEVSGHRLRVAAIEAVDGTPILDIKPVLLQPDRR